MTPAQRHALWALIALAISATALVITTHTVIVQSVDLARACQAGHAATASPLQDSLFTLASGCR